MSIWPGRDCDGGTDFGPSFPFEPKNILMLSGISCCVGSETQGMIRGMQYFCMIVDIDGYLSPSDRAYRSRGPPKDLGRNPIPKSSLENLSEGCICHLSSVAFEPRLLRGLHYYTETLIKDVEDFAPPQWRGA